MDADEGEELNSLSGLYPLGCILSHDCLANTVHTFESVEVSINSFNRIYLILMSISLTFNLTKLWPLFFIASLWTMNIRKGSLWQCGPGEQLKRGTRSPTAMSTLRWLCYFTYTCNDDFDFSGSVSGKTRIVENGQILPLHLLKVYSYKADFSPDENSPKYYDIK